MSEYLGVLRPFGINFGIPPPSVGDKAEWYEGKARERMLRLTAVVYSGMLGILGISLNGGVSKLYSPYQREIPKRKELIDLAIKERRVAVSTLFKEKLGFVGDGLTHLGLAGLGILREVCPDNIREAGLRLRALELILRENGMAAIIFSDFQEVFDGNRLVGDSIREANMVSLDPKTLLKLTA